MYQSSPSEGEHTQIIAKEQNQQHPQKLKLPITTANIQKQWHVARSSLHTLVLERWLGSSLDCSIPAPSVGSWVWKIVMRPPVGDMSLKAACNAGPRALWVSLVWLNMAGSEVSRSCTSWRREERGGGFKSGSRGLTTFKFKCQEKRRRRETQMRRQQIHEGEGIRGENRRMENRGREGATKRERKSRRKEGGNKIKQKQECK